jgi:hypothetical protein
MKPEDCFHGLFDGHPQPVAPRDMQQFVAEHRVLRIGRQVEQSSREQHDRTTDAEGDWLCDPIVPPELSRRRRGVLQAVDVGAQRGRRAVLPQVPESQQTKRQTE